MTASEGLLTRLPLPAGTWRVDPGRSVASFSARGLGGVEVTGTVPLVSGSVEVDAAGRVRAATGTCDPAGVATGSARRDADLRGPRLFDVAAFPRWTLVAGPAEGSPPERVEGVLTVRAACPLVLALEAVELDGAQARVVATSVLDRRDAGVHVPRVLVARRVRVRLDLHLVRQ